ncbi:MAG: response regulator transcription factor [Saprospiraceae bacterium]|nr:response regulator transcription factor [Saprospiraceae bacterium]
MAYRVLIVDDEPLAQDILERYILKVPELVICGKCKNVIEAYNLMHQEKPDLILLDINMPEISGIDFLKGLSDKPFVIFTTAYAEYALDGFELNAVDYLLKPFPLSRFIQAVQKFISLAQANTNLQNQSNPSAEKAVFLKSNGKFIRVFLKELCFVEGLNDYVRIWTTSKKIIVYTKMKNLEVQLASHPEFKRINKSYIVNLNFIEEVEGNFVRIFGQQITIGNTFRTEVSEWIQKNRLG